MPKMNNHHSSQTSRLHSASTARIRSTYRKRALCAAVARPSTTINHLPDELLDPILGRAAYNRQCGVHYRAYTSAATISLVCWRFYRLSIPYLYAHVYVGHGTPPKVTQLLHRSCVRNPALRRFVRGLTINLATYVPSFRRDLVEFTLDFISWFTATRTLEVILEKPEYSWPLLHLATLHLSSLQSVKLMSGWDQECQLELPVVLSIIDHVKNLKRLALNNLCPGWSLVVSLLRLNVCLWYLLTAIEKFKSNRNVHRTSADWISRHIGSPY